MKEINVGGKMLPIHFGIRAIAEFSQMAGVEFSQAVAGEPLGMLENIIKLTMFGLNEAARRQKSKERYSTDDVWDMFDDNPELMVKVTEIFTESVTPLMERLSAPGEDFSKPTQQ